MTTVEFKRKFALDRACAKCGATVERQNVTTRTDTYMTTGRQDLVVVSTENLPCGHVWVGGDPSTATARLITNVQLESYGPDADPLPPMAFPEPGAS